MRAVGTRKRALLGHAEPEKKSACAAILFFFFKNVK
jgi:hypothetical protein